MRQFSDSLIDVVRNRGISNLGDYSLVRERLANPELVKFNYPHRHQVKEEREPITEKWQAALFVFGFYSEQENRE